MESTEPKRVRSWKAVALALGGMVVGLVAMVTLALVTYGDAHGNWEEVPTEKVYRRLCASCHGPNGTAPTGTANTLKGKRRYWDVESIVEYVADPSAFRHRNSQRFPTLGKRVMQPIPRQVPMETRRRLAQYVYDELMTD